MTVITDAKKMLRDCQLTENSIYDHVSFYTNHEDIVAIQYLIKQVPKIVKECKTMLHLLLIQDDGKTTVKLRNDLRRMILRLEAAIMYAKNYFKLEEPSDT